MKLDLIESPVEDLEEYARVSIAFPVKRFLVPAPEVGPRALREVVAESVVWKDYDAEPGAHPSRWPERFDTSAWRIITARHDGRRIGGVVLLQGLAEIDMLEGRDDLALIWDLRVAAAERGRGVGTELLRAAERWARSRGCTELKVETQNVNLPACRFYEKLGFELRTMDPSAYPTLPDEIQLLWYKSL